MKTKLTLIAVMFGLTALGVGERAEARNYDRDAVAGEVRIAASASVETRRATPKATRAAFDAAKIKALERYVSQQQRLLVQYERCVRPNIKDTIDDYLLNATRLRTDFDKSLRELTVTAEVTINVSRLRNTLSACGVARGRMSFVFIACEDLGGDRYRPMRLNSAVEQSVREFFLENGYRMSDNMRLEEYNERFRRADLEDQCASKNGRINFSEAQKAAELIGSDYFAYGIFYVRTTGKDPVTGMERATAVGQGALIDLSLPGGEVISTGADVSRPGLQASGGEAMVEARRRAAVALAERMVSQVNAAD